MNNLTKIKQFFSKKERLSLEQLRSIRGGNTTLPDIPVIASPTAVEVLAALDDNKRPERPGGGVSTH